MSTVTREPAWLTAAADQRLALADESVGSTAFIKGLTVIMMTLTDPADESPEAFARWDKSCDNCGKYLPDLLVNAHIERSLYDKPVVIVLGACADCWELP